MRCSGPDPEQHRGALEEADRLGEVLDGLLALARADRPVTDRAVDAARLLEVPPGR